MKTKTKRQPDYVASVYYSYSRNGWKYLVRITDSKDTRGYFKYLNKRLKLTKSAPSKRFNSMREAIGSVFAFSKENNYQTRTTNKDPYRYQISLYQQHGEKPNDSS